MILDPGVRVLVAHRRLFEGDQNRYFAGTVDGYEDGVARVTGYTWIRDSYSGEFRRKDDARTKIISLASGTLFVYQLPSEVDVSKLEIRTEDGGLFLVGSSRFRMDITESIIGARDVPLDRRVG
ncbi:MAG: hypothetical protein GY711_21290 [bacterium]|nr:hypothetical protein [bacterium]